MRKIVYMATMCVSACLSMKGFADGDATNKEVSSTLTNVKPSFVESVDAKINRLNQLEQSVSSNSGDIAEIHQLKEEMDKTGVDLALSNGMHKVASTKRAESLAMLTRLQKGYRLGIETTVNPAPAQKQVINEIRATRKTLAEAGAIPVWDGSKWFDGRNLAIKCEAGCPRARAWRCACKRRPRA